MVVVAAAVVMMMMIIIIGRHELGLYVPVSASSNSLLKVLPNRLRSFGQYFNIIFGTLLLFILVTCRRQFDLYLLSFLSNRYTFDSSKISSFLLWSKSVYRLFWEISSRVMSVVFYPFF